MRLVTLSAGDLRAAFAPDQSMVGSSLTHRAEELLGLRGGLEAWSQRGRTMGIPLLHPWANRLSGWSYDVAGRHVELPRGSAQVRPEEHGLPIHGLLHGETSWEVTEQTEAAVRARFDFAADRRRMRMFPFAHVIGVHAVLDPVGLQLTTSVTATGDVDVPIAFGYHPYLVMPGARRAEWTVETTVSHHLVLDAHSVPTGEVRAEPVAAGPLGDRVLDEGYESAHGAWLRVRDGTRTVDIRFLEGYTHAQLFAPAGEGVIAFEPMTAPADALRSGRALRTVAPGETFSAAFRIDVYG
ncbi:MAG: aldose 1-epimerase [Solirubrobacteraceae bacterium]